MKLFGLEIKRNKEQNIEQRSSVPDKVFVEKEDSEFTYSPDEPHALQETFYNLLNGFYARQNYITLFYAVPEIFAPVHEIARRVSDCNWQLLKDWNDEIDYKDKDFNRLFSTPNPIQDIRDLIYQAVCYELLTGRNFFFMNRPTVLASRYDNILSWYNLQEPNVTVVMDKGADIYSATEINDIVLAYKIGSRSFERSNVMPLFNMHLEGKFDLNNCQSYLKGADMAIKNLVPVYQARGAIYLKRGQMGMWVSAAKDESGTVALLPKEKKALRNEMNADYGLTGGRDTVGISDVPVNFIKSSMTIQEMQPFDETLADALVIYKVLRVPQHLVPRKDQSTFNNTDAEMRSFYTDVIIPMAKRYASVFTTRMGFNLNRRYIKADYSHIEYLQTDLKKKAEGEKVNIENALTLYKEGIIKKNERNALLGYTSVEDGNVYVGEGGNKDPLAVQLGVGGVQALQGLLADPALDADAKKNALIIIFGIDEYDAAKMVSKNENNNTPPKNPGA